jgi:hypothetical protein
LRRFALLAEKSTPSMGFDAAIFAGLGENGDEDVGD